MINIQFFSTTFIYIIFIVKLELKYFKLLIMSDQIIDI